MSIGLGCGALGEPSLDALQVQALFAGAVQLGVTVFDAEYVPRPTSHSVALWCAIEYQNVSLVEQTAENVRNPVGAEPLTVNAPVPVVVDVSLTRSAVMCAIK
jgi:hypothetical protein